MFLILNVIFRNDSQMWYLENHNNWFNLTISVVMKIAVASLGNFHAKPFGPELQVNQMLHRRFAREDWERNKFEWTWFEKKICL